MDAISSLPRQILRSYLGLGTWNQVQVPVPTFARDVPFSLPKPPTISI